MTSHRRIPSALTGCALAALALGACAPDGATGPAARATAGPSAAQPSLAEAPWFTKTGYVLLAGVEYPVTVRYRTWVEYPGYAGVAASVEYEITSPLGAALQCGYTGFVTSSFRTVPCAGTLAVGIPDFGSYTLPDLGDYVLELYGTTGGYNHTGARVFRGHDYLPYRVVGLAERVAPEKVKGRDPNKKATQAARKAFAEACGHGRLTGCVQYAVFSPGNLTGHHTPYAVTIDWGDGSAADASAPQSAFSTPGGPLPVTARHVYAAPGTYTVRVRAANSLTTTGSHGRAMHEARTTVVIE